MNNADVYAALKYLKHRPESRLHEIREAWEQQDYRYLGLLVSRVLDDYVDEHPAPDALIVERSDIAHDRQIDREAA